MAVSNSYPLTNTVDWSVHAPGTPSAVGREIDQALTVMRDRGWHPVALTVRLHPWETNARGALRTVAMTFELRRPDSPAARLKLVFGTEAYPISSRSHDS